MKNYKLTLALILVVLLAIGGLYRLRGRQNEMKRVNQAAAENRGGETDAADEAEVERVLAPDFVVYDQAGKAVRLSEFKGKPVVMNFWASWCGPCKSEMPDFDEAYAELGQDVHFLMINMTTTSGESFEQAKAFIEAQGYQFPVYYDMDSDASLTYGIHSYPTTIFVDAEGYAIAQAIGAIDRDILQQGIDMIRAG